MTEKKDSELFEEWFEKMRNPFWRSNDEVLQSYKDTFLAGLEAGREESFEGLKDNIIPEYIALRRKDLMKRDEQWQSKVAELRKEIKKHINDIDKGNKGWEFMCCIDVLNETLEFIDRIFGKEENP